MLQILPVVPDCAGIAPAERQCACQVNFSAVNFVSFVRRLYFCRAFRMKCKYFVAQLSTRTGTSNKIQGQYLYHVEAVHIAQASPWWYRGSSRPEWIMAEFCAFFHALKSAWPL